MFIRTKCRIIGKRPTISLDIFDRVFIHQIIFIHFSNSVCLATSEHVGLVTGRNVGRVIGEHVG